MFVVSRKTNNPTIESVTVTLTVNEVQAILNSIEYRGWFEDDSLKFALQRAIQPSPSVLGPREILDNGVCDANLVRGEKIKAIKSLRYLTGCSLKEGKDAVDDYAAEKGW